MLTRAITAENNLITIAEAAQILGYAKKTLANKQSLGELDLRPVRVGRTIRFIEADVWALKDRWIAGRK